LDNYLLILSVAEFNTDFPTKFNDVNGVRVKALPYLMGRRSPWVAAAKPRRSTGTQTDDRVEATRSTSESSSALFAYTDVRMRDRATEMKKLEKLESSAGVKALRERLARLSHKDK
jgi:hypothetical protein